GTPPHFSCDAAARPRPAPHLFGDMIRNHPRRFAPLLGVLAVVPAAISQTAPSVRVLLPERTRLLQGQLIDLVLEVRNASAVSNLKVTAGAVDLTPKFGAPAKASLDCDTSSDWVIRANLQSFDTPGVVRLDVSL